MIRSTESKFSVSSDSTHGAIGDNPFKARVSVLQAQAEYLTIENVTCESLDEQCRNGSNTSEDQVSTGWSGLVYVLSACERHVESLHG